MEQFDAMQAQLDDVRARIAALDGDIAYIRTQLDDPQMPERHGVDYLSWRTKRKYTLTRHIRERKVLDALRLKLQADQTKIRQQAKADRRAEREERLAKAMETATDEARLVRDLYATVAWISRKYDVPLNERNRSVLDAAHAYLVQTGLFEV